MDVRAIRSDLADAAASVGFSAVDFMPAALQDLPQAVVGPPLSIERHNKFHAWGLFPCTFFVSADDLKDAAERLDAVCSLGVEGSYVDACDSNTTTFERTDGTYELVGSDESGYALAVTIVVRVES